MLERRLVAELDSAPLIVLDPSGADSEEALDMAVRAAASLCVHLGQSGGCAILLPGERRPIEIGHDLAGWAGVHARLALVEEGPAPPASTLGPRGGAVIWVTGAGAAGAPRALERMPAGARIFVSPAVVPGARALFEVAGCTGYLVERAPQGDRGVSAIGARPAARAPARRPRRPLERERAARGVRCAWRRSRRWPCSPAPTGSRWSTSPPRRPHRPGGRHLHLHRRALLLALGAPAVRARVHGAVIAAAAVAIGLIGIVLALGAIGLPLRLIGPNNWDELSDGLDRGLAGVQTVEWPYRGSDYWVRLTTLMGGPLLIALAAALAFFPARRGTAALSWAGLVLLLLAYGSAVTEKDPGAPLLRGLALLVLVGAWLWLPRLGPREALARRGSRAGAGCAVAAGRGRARRRQAVVELRRLDLARERQGDHLRLEPPLRPARLAARRDDAAQGQVGPAALLEGRDARHLRRDSLGARRHERLDARAPGRSRRATPPTASWDYFEWNRKWDEELGLHRPVAVAPTCSSRPAPRI